MLLLYIRKSEPQGAGKQAGGLQGVQQFSAEQHSGWRAEEAMSVGGQNRSHSLGRNPTFGAQFAAAPMPTADCGNLAFTRSTSFPAAHRTNRRPSKLFKLTPRTVAKCMVVRLRSIQGIRSSVTDSALRLLKASLTVAFDADAMTLFR